mmetsp:Transcript_25023/g.38702  ORF Transcript_25023/g.38702 Transcript_25023/m.38702 type:complete len:91 (+) Transcript_25023:2245-2517(+)
MGSIYQHMLECNAGDVVQFGRLIELFSVLYNFTPRSAISSKFVEVLDTTVYSIANAAGFNERPSHRSGTITSSNYLNNKTATFIQNTRLR